MERFRGILRHVLLFITAAFVLLPFVWMVSLSIKSPGEIFHMRFSLWPDHFYGLQNYAAALTTAPLLRFILNGVWVCAAIVAIQLLVCAPCAYALAKLEFKGRELFFSLVLVGLLIPAQVLALPLFVLSAKCGILNSYAVQILPFTVSPFGIFLLRQFFKAIPDDIVQAARLDGLSHWAIVWRVMIPMARPAVIAFAVFSVVSHWNDLLWPLITVRSEALMPPAMGIVAFRNDEAGNDFGPMMAAAVMVVAPLVAAFLAAQRAFVEGLMAGGVK